MATVNFSVPDELKAEFDRVFTGQNKSALIAELMRKAVADNARRARREELFRRLTERRGQRPSVSGRKTRAARVSGRP
jgi:metal-responsive CopG/Arc/MetJ family transcriptional regulator